MRLFVNGWKRPLLTMAPGCDLGITFFRPLLFGRQVPSSVITYGPTTVAWPSCVALPAAACMAIMLKLPQTLLVY